MTREEFIEMLQAKSETNISMTDSLETAEEIEVGAGDEYSYTPALTSVNDRLYIIQGTQETG